MSGRELSRRFYEEQVRSVLHLGFPGLPYSAALLGRGSEVLGFDDEMSRDHNWEPRVLLFLRDDDYARYGEAVERFLGDALPDRFAGYPTQFSLSTLRTYVQEHLDLDVDGGIEARDWLTLPDSGSAWPRPELCSTMRSGYRSCATAWPTTRTTCGSTC